MLVNTIFIISEGEGQRYYAFLTIAFVNTSCAFRSNSCAFENNSCVFVSNTRCNL